MQIIGTTLVFVKCILNKIVHENNSFMLLLGFGEYEERSTLLQKEVRKIM